MSKERQVIERVWKNAEMAEFTTNHLHPECAATERPCEVAGLMQDEAGRFIDVSSENYSETMRAVSFLDVHREATCINCGGLLRQPPAWVALKWVERKATA